MSGTQPSMQPTSQDTSELRKTKFASLPDKPKPRSFLQRSAFAITITLCYCVDGIVANVLGQYRYHYFHLLHEEELNKFNVTQECGGEEVQSDVKAIEDQISEETAKWSLYKNYVVTVPLITASVILGMKSDHVGRRFLFLFPFLASFIDVILLAIIVKFKFHFGYTLIGNFLTAMSGGTITMNFAGYALISDTHGKKDNSNGKPEKVAETLESDELDPRKEKSRILKIVLLDSCKHLPNAAFSLAVGYIIQYAGYFYSVILAIGLKCGIFVFAYCFVTETGEQRKSSGFIAPLKTIYRSVRDPWKRLLLLIVNLGQLSAVFGYICELEIMRLYQLSPPFCFTSIQLGWYNSEALVKMVFGVPFIYLWQRMRLNEGTIAAIGAACEAAAAISIASVARFWIFFVAPVIGMPGNLNLTMAKIVTSRLVGHNALASTFAVMLAIEEVFFFVAGISANYLYQSTLDTLPAAPIYMSGCAFAVGSLLYLTLGCLQRSRSYDTEEEIEITVTQNGAEQGRSNLEKI